MYFFHYTTQKNFETMTQARPWNCEARQPQKDSYYFDQHEVGFYVTALSPSEMSSEKARKTGGGGKSGDYVLVFNINVKAKEITKGSPFAIEGTMRLKLVGQPVKFAFTPYGSDPDGKPVPFTAAMCVWAGAVENCSSAYANDTAVLESLYKK